MTSTDPSFKNARAVCHDAITVVEHVQASVNVWESDSAFPDSCIVSPYGTEEKNILTKSWKTIETWFSAGRTDAITCSSETEMTLVDWIAEKHIPRALMHVRGLSVSGAAPSLGGAAVDALNTRKDQWPSCWRLVSPLGEHMTWHALE